MIHILHLSDIHLGTKDDASQYRSQLIADLTVELEIDRLDYLVVSGDIGTYSTKEEYEAAAELITQIAKRYHVPEERRIVAPGNHDLNWDISEKAYEIVYKRKYPDKLPKEIAEKAVKAGDVGWMVRDDKKYRKRFAHFSKHFYEPVAGKAYPEKEDEQGIVSIDRDNRIVFLSMNSCWEIDHFHKDRSGIHRIALANALDALDREGCVGEDWLKIAVWHHPVTGAQTMKDTAFLQQLSVRGIKAALHGHIHEAEKGHYDYDTERGIHLVGAGTFGAPAPEQVPGIPHQYNLLVYDREKGEITVHTRKKDKPMGAWDPDYRWGKKNDKKPWYAIQVRGPAKAPETDNDQTSSSSTNHAEPDPPEPDDPEPDKKPTQKEIDDYRKKCESLHASLPLVGFGVSLRVPIRLEDIYVPLRAMVDRRLTGKACFADAADAEDKLRECGGGNEISVPDAFQEAKKVGRHGVVILGDPGSGKTTHLKRVLLWCLKGGPESIGLPPDMLPVFLPLRELRDTRMKLEDFIRRQLDLPHLETPEGFGRRLMKRGNLLFLLDGLDEVAESDRRSGVSRWIEKAHDLYDTCWFPVTSRFAGYTEKARLGPQFLEMHMRPLSEDQASRFIHNWYGIVKREQQPDDPSQAAQLAEDEAERLIERLKAPGFRASRVFEMTRNPLLLTCLCLVHLDRGNLPHTRAALYEECIDVLLERWRAAADIQSFRNSVGSSQHVEIIQHICNFISHSLTKRRSFHSKKVAFDRVFAGFIEI